RCTPLSVCSFNATATTEIYTLSLHDALPIFRLRYLCRRFGRAQHGDGRGLLPEPDTERPDAGLQSFLLSGLARMAAGWRTWRARDRKSTRLNSSHVKISYAVFCLKKKKCKST